MAEHEKLPATRGGNEGVQGAKPSSRNPLDSVAGFGVTLHTIIKKPTTEMYPEEKVPTALRFHGRHQLNRHPDGLEKCIGCELCAWACPADAIYVEGADNTEEERFSPGERYGKVYQINYLRCILCGLCIEACPTRALTMTNEYELADTSRESLIYDKDRLLGPMADGMMAAPHEMYPGTTEKEYYRGQVTKSVPEQAYPVSATENTDDLDAQAAATATAAAVAAAAGDEPGEAATA